MWEVGVSGSSQYDPRWHFPGLAYETTVSAGDGIAAFLMVRNGAAFFGKHLLS